MKRLKENQKHGCTYCRKEGVKTKAIWRQKHCADFHACEKHRPNLELYELQISGLDSRLSKADIRTWRRIP